MQRFFKNNPMLIMAFPLIAGIAFSWLVGTSLLTSVILFLLSSTLLFAAFLYSKSRRGLFVASLVLALLSLGVFTETLDRSTLEQQWSGTKGRFEAVLLEAPHVGGKATRVKAEVERLGRDSIIDARRVGVVYLYFENSVSLESLTVGDKILFNGKVEPAHNAGNPAEFDTEHYLYVNGISGTAYVGRKEWGLCAKSAPTIPMRAMMLRERVVRMYSSLGLSSESQEILSALTVGEKRDLSKGVRELYAAVGASHVLALSGLHLGILYLVLTFLFPVGSSRLLRLLREGVLLLLLWGFAAVAGFTPSVVRAAILFTLMALSRCMQRDGSSINSLAFAAVVMLVYCPRWLFDVGFQLSFSAVLSILLLTPYIDNLLGVNNRGVIYRYIAGVLSVSFAAQIGTFPFIWYYFGTFPLYFLATNLLVVPSAFIIMLLAVVLLLFFYVDILRAAVAYILDTLISAVNDALRFIESLPYSSLQLPYIDAWLVCVVITGILALGYAVINKRWRYIVVTLVATLIVGGYTLYRSNKNVEPHIIFFNSRGFSAVQIVESRKCSYLLSTYPQLEVDGRYIVEPYCRREGICEPLILPYCSYNDYADENITISNGLLTYAHRRVKMLSDQDWESESSIQPVDCIVLCRGFSGSIKELVLRYPTRYIMLDATLYSSSVKRIQRECKNIGLRCVNIAKSGAHKFLVNRTGVRIVPVE